MGMYSYDCIAVTKATKVAAYGSKTLYVCDMQFENENGRAFAPVDNVLVSVEDDCAELCDYPEDVLPEGGSWGDKEWDEVQKLCDDNSGPNHEVDNPEQFSKLVLAAIG